MSEYKKMDPNIKKRWLKALRSRKYKQTTGALCDVSENGKESFCCLGVLADIAGGHHGYWKLKADGRGYLFQDNESFNSYEGSLSSKLLNYVGVSTTTEAELITMNDDGAKFYQIARWIERNL